MQPEKLQSELLIFSSDFTADFYTLDGRFHRAIESIYANSFVAMRQHETACSNIKVSDFS